MALLDVWLAYPHGGGIPRKIEYNEYDRNDVPKVIVCGDEAYVLNPEMYQNDHGVKRRVYLASGRPVRAY